MEITQKVGFSLCSFGFNCCHCHSDYVSISISSYKLNYS